MSATQKALSIASKEATSYAVISRPIPKPAAGQLLIKIHSIGLNPADWKLHAIGMLDRYPAILGNDCSGTVEVVGDGVTGFKVGDRVAYCGFFVVDDLAAFQQYVIAFPDLVAKIPASLSFEQAATLPACINVGAASLYSESAKGGLGLTAPWLDGGVGKYKGQKIVILGGSSAVGQSAIQWAALSGFTVITTASAASAAYLKSLGATEVIDRRSSTLAEDVVKAAGGKVALVVDAFGEDQPLAVEISKSDAAISLLLPPNPNLKKEDRTIVHVTAGHPHIDKEFAAQLIKALPAYLEKGVIKPNRVQVVEGGLAGIPNAFEKMREGSISATKLVVHAWD